VRAERVMTPSIPVGPAERLSGTRATAAYVVLGLWAAYLLTAPTSGFAWIDSWHNEQRAVQVILLSLTTLVLASLASFSPERVLARIQFPWWWWAFVALGTISALASQLPFAAFAEIGLFLMLSALVMLTAALTANQPERMRKVARHCALLISMAHVLAVMVRYLAALQLGNGIDVTVFMLGYANPRFASALYAVLIPFVAGTAADSDERPALRATAFGALCLLWTINIGLGTRGIWFAYGLAMPAVSLLIGVRSSVRSFGAIVLAAVLGIVLYIALSTGAGDNGDGTAAAVLSGDRLRVLTSREVLWALSWDTIAQHPLLGIGPMHFATLKSHVGAHPHNWPLQVAAEWGLPALGMLLFALCRRVLFLHKVRGMKASANAEASLAVGVALVYGLVDGNLVMPVSQSAAALALGLALGGDQAPAQSKWGSVKGQLGGIALISAVVVVCIYAQRTLEDQPRAVADFRARYPHAWLVPRFWESGLTLVALRPSENAEQASTQRGQSCAQRFGPFTFRSDHSQDLLLGHRVSLLRHGECPQPFDVTQRLLHAIGQR